MILTGTVLKEWRGEEGQRAGESWGNHRQRRLVWGVPPKWREVELELEDYFGLRNFVFHLLFKTHDKKACLC